MSVHFEHTVEGRLYCIGPWCRQYPGEQEALYFITAAESNLRSMLKMPACHDTRFPTSEAERFISHLEGTCVLNGEDETDAEMGADPYEAAAASVSKD